MNFKFPCPHCGQRIGAALEDVGTTGGCPACQRQFVVPAPPEAAPQPAFQPAAVKPVQIAPNPVVVPTTKRGVAIVALLLSIFPVINLLALGLAIYAVVRSDRPGRSGERGLAIAAVVVAGLMLVPVNLAGALVASTKVLYKPAVVIPDFSPGPASPTPAKPAAH